MNASGRQVRPQFLARTHVRSARALCMATLALMVGCASRTEGPERDATTTAAAQPDAILPAASAGEPASSFPAPTRPVSDIVAPRWSAEDDRDNDGEFARVVRLAGIRRGMRVADIGAGDGYYVSRLSPIVDSTGLVYGNDIILEYLQLLQRRVTRERLANVQVVLGDPHDPRLPAGRVNVALMIHMYHEIEQPFGLLWNLATSMTPGGTLVILDLDRPTNSHGTPPSLLRCELAAVGYKERSFTRTGPEEYVAIFEAPAIADRESAAAITTRLISQPCRVP